MIPYHTPDFNLRNLLYLIHPEASSLGAFVDNTRCVLSPILFKRRRAEAYRFGSAALCHNKAHWCSSGVVRRLSGRKSIGNPALLDYLQLLPWQTNKILIFLIFPVFSGFSSLFTFLHFSLILAYFGISLHIFVINFGKNFGKFQVCTKGKSAIGNRQVRNWGLR